MAASSINPRDGGAITQRLQWQLALAAAAAAAALGDVRCWGYQRVQ